MGCGCGGSKLDRLGRERQARQAQARTGDGRREPVEFGDPGFTWNGPQRPIPPVAPAAPTPAVR